MTATTKSKNIPRSSTRGTEKQQDSIRGGYFLWLCAKVERRENADKRSCLHFLFEKEFYPVIRNDENRVADGLYLRQLFSDEAGVDAVDILQTYPCSMLEVMISLSNRMEYEVGDRVQTWFWRLVENLGLIIAPMSDPDDRTARLVSHENDKIVNTFLKRMYKASGKGGLFPLRHATVDQRTVELWSQMQAYLQERFTI